MFKKQKSIVIVSKQKNTYSSFPTAVIDNNNISIFFRQGEVQSKQPHGYYGKVIKMSYPLDEFLELSENPKNSNSKPKKQTIFQGDNEIDAIASKLEEDVFTLGTREYLKGFPMKTYLSFSNSTNFKDRMEIKIKGTQWIIFYGKAFKTGLGYIFPAYGPLTKDTRSRPLVLITDDFKHWEILSNIESNIFLNESSIAFDGKSYHLFMRENENEFGIWHTTSKNLENWEKPNKLFSNAHAPMAFSFDNEVYLTYRDIIETEKACVSLYNMKNKEKTILDSYLGNVYDGGYSDPIFINNKLFVFYYLGNVEGEPEIKCSILEA